LVVKMRRSAKSASRRKKRVLLVVPDFPIPAKRRIMHNFAPIGLLKIGTYLRDARGCEVELVFGEKNPSINPDEVWITSLFTYWSEYVHRSARYYGALFPNARIRIGGIYASLMPDSVRKETGGDVHVGVYSAAERWCGRYGVDYSLLKEHVDFQILHGMRGCFRRCEFCGTWKIEPRETFDSNIPGKVSMNHVVFYDNNFLRNPHIREMLKDLSNIKVNDRHVVYESQSGFDGRILDQELAFLLKRARFVNPRIAWDNSYSDAYKIEKQIRFLTTAGYKPRDIYVFVLYNWDYDFNTLENKRLKCWEWGVQISDCRFRPLNQLYDSFNSRRRQTSANYYIHSNWKDEEVKQFRANVRKHNICARHKFRFHSTILEQMRLSKRRAKEFRVMPRSEVRRILSDAWFPDEFHGPSTPGSKFGNLSSENHPKSSIPQCSIA